MKAICGFLHLDQQPAAPAALDALREALVYNPATFAAGSDRVRGEGLVRGNLALGSARWSHQPATLAGSQLAEHPASGCVAVADARIANRAALAAALDLDPFLANDSATLLLHGWLRWGEDCVARIEGDFAFAVFDPRTQRLFCARDRMGVRPLYIHHAPGRLFAFASRASALLALPQVPRDLDEGRIADALIDPLESIDKTSTFYAAIRRLPPAHVLDVDRQRMRRRRYWQALPGAHTPLPRNDDAWQQALTAVLEDAVRAHLDGDVAVGCMVSGGMDSSSLALIARDQLAAAGRGPLPTFSCIDDDPACAETAAIRAVLAQPGYAPHLAGPAQIDAMAVDLRAAILASEEPFDIGMTLLHAQYLMAARSGVGAVMDGIDADVLLSEGDAMVRQVRHGHWRSAWRNARGIQRIYPGVRAWRQLAHAARAALTPDLVRVPLRRLRMPIRVRDNIRSSLLDPGFAARIDLRERLQRFSQWRPPGTANSAQAQATVSLDHPFTTSGFERYYRVAAWHGVEPRHPFDDRAVMELCVELPDRQRIRNGWPKAVLRHAMHGRLPGPVCWRSGKEHLGWNVTRRVLADGDDTLQQLAACRPVLAPYVAGPRLDALLRDGWQAMGDEARTGVLQALALGLWLQRHAQGPSATIAGNAHARM